MEQLIVLTVVVEQQTFTKALEVWQQILTKIDGIQDPQVHNV